MRAYNIAAHEADFHKTLTDASGKKFVASPGLFSNTTRLTAAVNNYYYSSVVEKEFVTLHATWGILHGDIAALTTQHVSVAFVVARDGVIYELFDPKYWSYHLGYGAGSTYNNTEKSSKSIAIEISNIGPLTLKNGTLFDIYNTAYCLESDSQYYVECSHRGYNYYATYTDDQYNSLSSLIPNICAAFNIKHEFPPPEERFAYHHSWPQYGIITHAMVRADKADLPPCFDFSKIASIPGGL